MAGRPREIPGNPETTNDVIEQITRGFLTSALLLSCREVSDVMSVRWWRQKGRGRRQTGGGWRQQWRRSQPAEIRFFPIFSTYFCNKHGFLLAVVVYDKYKTTLVSDPRHRLTLIDFLCVKRYKYLNSQKRATVYSHDKMGPIQKTKKSCFRLFEMEYSVGLPC